MYKLFDKWDTTEIEVKDLSVERYINLKPVLLPYSGGKHARQQFNKSNQHIVERLINRMMQSEHNTGKKMTTYKIVKNSLEVINKKTKENPIQVLVNAIINAGPREETVRFQKLWILPPSAG
jgi:small subunit ribosomal protein S7